MAHPPFLALPLVVHLRRYFQQFSLTENTLKTISCSSYFSDHNSRIGFRTVIGRSLSPRAIPADTDCTIVSTRQRVRQDLLKTCISFMDVAFSTYFPLRTPFDQ